MQTVLRKRRAVASIVATLMLMLITVMTLAMTLSFVQSNLTRREAENEFTFAKVFMKTVGLQVDDVAWQTGQLDSLQYSSQNSEMFLREGILRYTVTINYAGSPAPTSETLTYTLNGLFYSIPISKYNLENLYHESILPGEMTKLVQNKPTEPITRVFVVQKNPIGTEGDYVRIGVIPLFRYTEYSLTFSSGTTEYKKFFLTDLVTGLGTPSSPQYINLYSSKIDSFIRRGVTSMIFTVEYPRAAEGYDSEFFNFKDKNGASLESKTLTFSPTDGVTVEIYVSTVEVGYRN
jgi:hypothetical protein